MFIISISDILNTIQLRGRVYQIKKKKKQRELQPFLLSEIVKCMCIQQWVCIMGIWI